MDVLVAIVLAMVLWAGAEDANEYMRSRKHRLRSQRRRMIARNRR